MLWRGLAGCREFIKRFHRTTSFVAALLALLLGFFVYYFGQGLDHVDALYLTIVTISTVGYGDYTPSLACIDDDGNEIFGSTSRCVGLRVFTIFYILIGVAFIFSQLANLFAGQLETFSQFVKRQIDRLWTPRRPRSTPRATARPTPTWRAGRWGSVAGGATSQVSALSLSPHHTIPLRSNLAPLDPSQATASPTSSSRPPRSCTGRRSCCPRWCS